MQINCVYKNGSTGKIIYDIHSGLMERGVHSIVCYGRGKKESGSNVYKTCGELYSKFNQFMSRITGIMYGGCFWSTNYLIALIKKEKPDIVHLQCINGYFVNIYRLLEWIKKNDINTVITLHAEFLYTGGCGYALECEKWKEDTGCGECSQWKSETKSFFRDGTHTMWKRMQKAFEGFGEKLIIVSVSPWLKERAEVSKILCEKKHKIVLNGLETNIFHPYSTEKLRKKHNLRKENIIFFATPYFNLNPKHIKGGYYVMELAKKMVKENVKFIIAGPYDEKIVVPSNVILLGKVSDQTRLAQYYSLADVTLLTSKRETFSMVTAESLSCGTPVVGFKAGAPETIALSEFCTFVDYGDLDALYMAVKQRLLIKKDTEIANKAYNLYDKRQMIENYMKIYQLLMEDKIDEM